jgi:hypothetical protein
VRSPSASVGLICSFPVVWAGLVAGPTFHLVQFADSHSDRALAVIFVGVVSFEFIRFALSIAQPVDETRVRQKSRIAPLGRRLSEVLVALAGVSATQLALALLGIRFGHNPSQAVLVLTVAATPLVNQVTLAIMSRLARRSCTIGFFRSFYLSDAEEIRIRQALSGYGRVQLIGRDLLWDDRWSFLGYDSQAIADSNDARKTSEERWRDDASRIIRSSDVVVIDVSAVSEQVRWEIAQSQSILPPSRVLFVTSSRSIDMGDRESFSIGASDRELSDVELGSLLRPLRREGGNVTFRLQLFLWMLER